ncbi:MAG: hypothetical protein IT304_09875 [Dehalococcoidia bacterium]|nr:hypothetical protein [Dehalococcoidia bacterium]
MPEFDYQNIEAWNSAVRLAAAVGRLKVGSNLKASGDAQQKAFEQAGLACALVAEGASREGPAQVGLYRDARGALAQCRAWLHILAALTNEPDTVFANELDLAETAARQISGMLRTIERAPSLGPRPPRPPAPVPGPRPANPPRGGPAR